MYLLRITIYAFSLALLVGCVSPQKLLDSNATPNTEHGYISGLFGGYGIGFGFIFVDVDVDDQKEYLMPFFKTRKSIHMQTYPEKLQIMSIPPGTYEMAYWVTYDPLINSEETRKEVIGTLRRTFQVKPSKIVFIGRYDARAEVTRNYASFNIYPFFYTNPTVDKLLRESYPNFSMEDIEFLK